MIRCGGFDVLNNGLGNSGIMEFMPLQFPGKRANNAFQSKVFPGCGFGQGAQMDVRQVGEG